MYVKFVVSDQLVYVKCLVGVVMTDDGFSSPRVF